MFLQTVAVDMPVGGYLNGLLAIPVLLVLLAWAKALSWVDKDAEAARMKRDVINSALMGGFILGFVAFILVPNFFLAFLALLIVVGIEAGVYLSMRKRAVGLADLKTDFKLWIRGFGRKEKPVEEIKGAVQIVGGNGALLPAPTANTPEAESYQGIQTLLTDPLLNNAEVIQLSPTESGITVNYTVDGMTYTGASVPRAIGAAAIAYLKAAAGLDIGEMRKPQKGGLKLNVGGRRQELQLETKGSTAGEFARFLRDVKGRHDFAPDTLGFTPEQQQTIKKMIQSGGGITLLTAPRTQGLTSLSYAIMRGHDAFLQNLVTIERDPEQDLEGITQNKLDRNATPVEEAKLVNWVISQQPNVLLIAKPENPESAVNLIAAAKSGQRIYCAFNANSTFDALAIWRKFVADDKLAMSQLQMVICGRVIRKLCAACKQGYAPDPETLRKLNMDAASVEILYQARKEPVRDAKGLPMKCEFCNDLRYKGRVGMFEILLVDDAIKQICTNGLSVEQNTAPMKAAFRKQGGKYLQEIGLEVVATGETSVQEVLRGLKAGAEGSGGGRSSSGGGAAGGPAPAKPRTPKGPVITA